MFSKINISCEYTWPGVIYQNLYEHMYLQNVCHMPVFDNLTEERTFAD